MPRVTQAHLDARRRQIVDAARTLFADQGFARTSMPDLADAAGLSIGAIYRYFPSKDAIVAAICDEAAQALPTELTAAALDAFLAHIRASAREEDHARLVAQIYAEAAIAPPLAELVARQLTALRTAVAELLTDRPQTEAADAAEAFVAVCLGYSHQLAVRGDLDPAPFARALLSVVEPPSTSH